MIFLASKLDHETILEIIRRFSFDCVFIHDASGNILFISDSYQRITGNAPSSLIGNNVSVLRKRNILDVAVGEKVLKSQEPSTMILDYKNGRDIMVTAIPVFDNKQELLAVVGNIRDITELRLLQDRLAQTESARQHTWHMLEEVKLQVFPDFGVVYESNAMRNLCLMAARIAKVNSTVLITGESGVGKDVYAQMIHKLMNEGLPAERPYIKVSCAAIPETLLESELFGYEYGAFTGAKKGGKPGAFELAKDGIVFLDEVGELPLFMQVKLLTVIQDRKFTRLGGVKTIDMNARLIAATNQDLEKAVASGEFREDLYYRLNVIPINIPPLREREEDILPLINMNLKRFNEKYHFSKRLDKRVIDRMLKYSWPGNVRELSNIIERMMVLSPVDIITEDYLPKTLDSTDTLPIQGLLEKDLSLQEFLDEMESLRIVKAVEKKQLLKDAAEELGIDVSTLTRKLKKHGIPRRNRRQYVHTELPQTKFE